jgi:hypothetical protein
MAVTHINKIAQPLDGTARRAGLPEGVSAYLINAQVVGAIKPVG